MHFPIRSGAFLLGALAVLSVGICRPAQSQTTTTSALCEDGECKAAISATQYLGRPAYRLTNGITEAVIVPEIGRIMSYGKVGGPNLLWNGPMPNPKDTWKNYGGDKNWLAPQSTWPNWQGKGWPPDVAFDGSPQKVDIITGGKVQMTTPLSVTGIRFIRTLYYADNGDLVIEQTARKEKGALTRASIWSITQVVPGDAIFLPTNPDSIYKGGYAKIQGRPKDQTFNLVKPTLLRAIPSTGQANSKVGVDSLVSGIASVRDGVAFVQKSPRPDGHYPDGTESGGFPVELFVNANPKTYYCELEILGPLKNFTVGTKSTHTVRWSLHDLPSKDVTSAAVVDAVEKLLVAPL